MRKLFLTLLAPCLSAICWTESAAGDEFLNTRALVKDVVSSNPGSEIIVPFIVEDDTNSDDYPDRIIVRFRVYPAGSQSVLFVTPSRAFVPPASPCTAPSFEDWDWDITLLGENNTHTGVLLLFANYCVEQADGAEREALHTFLYMADTRSSGASAWSKNYSSDVISANIVNWDADPAEEVKLILAGELGNQERGRVFFFNKSTGAKESERAYVLVQTN